MAYYARLDGNTVIAVHAVSDDIEDGAAFLADLHGGEPEAWMETFTDGRRGKQATTGDKYDPDLDEFISPAPPVEEE